MLDTNIHNKRILWLKRGWGCPLVGFKWINQKRDEKSLKQAHLILWVHLATQGSTVDTRTLQGLSGLIINIFRGNLVSQLSKFSCIIWWHLISSNFGLRHFDLDLKSGVMRSDQWVGKGNSRCSWRYSRPVGWEQDLHREKHHQQNLDFVSLYEQDCLWEKSMCTMGVGYESESRAGVVAPRLGGWEARSKSRSTKRQVLRQRLRARHWVHLHTLHKLKTGVPLPHSWVIWKCIKWGHGLDQHHVYKPSEFEPSETSTSLST